MNRVVSFGPKNCGPNLLLLSKDAKMDIWPGLIPAKNTANNNGNESNNCLNGANMRRDEMLCTVTLQVRDTVLLNLSILFHFILFYSILLYLTLFHYTYLFIYTFFVYLFIFSFTDDLLIHLFIYVFVHLFIYRLFYIGCFVIGCLVIDLAMNIFSYYFIVS